MIFIGIAIRRADDDCTFAVHRIEYTTDEKSIPWWSRRVGVKYHLMYSYSISKTTYLETEKDARGWALRYMRHFLYPVEFLYIGYMSYRDIYTYMSDDTLCVRSYPVLRKAYGGYGERKICYRVKLESLDVSEI